MRTSIELPDARLSGSNWSTNLALMAGLVGGRRLREASVMEGNPVHVPIVIPLSERKPRTIRYSTPPVSTRGLMIQGVAG